MENQFDRSKPSYAIFCLTLADIDDSFEELFSTEF